MCDEWETLIVSNERIFFLTMKALWQHRSILKVSNFVIWELLALKNMLVNIPSWSFFGLQWKRKFVENLIVQMYKTHSFDNIRECAPINATKQNNAFTCWATQGPKVTFFYKIGLHACLTNVYQTKSWIFLHILCTREDFMCKFQLRHANLHMRQSSQRYMKASCMKQSSHAHESSLTN